MRDGLQARPMLRSTCECATNGAYWRHTGTVMILIVDDDPKFLEKAGEVLDDDAAFTSRWMPHKPSTLSAASQSAGYRRPVPEPAGSRDRALRGREESSSGAESDAADFAARSGRAGPAVT